MYRIIIRGGSDRVRAQIDPPIRDNPMGIRDERVDAYIAKSGEFARPILGHLREVVHAACPEVEETIKWSSPHFQYQGMLCMMAAFKEHCAFGFWKGSLVIGEDKPSGEPARGEFGRIKTLSDLPSREILGDLIRKAMELNEAGIRSPTRSKARAVREIIVPDDLTDALSGNPAALAAFKGFSPSNKRDYVEWITEARTPATRGRRLVTAVEWMAEGKTRNWKYLNC
jgi:uncharacterized protein YdeI (YjbR/CyaY-like superfamily)